MTHMHKKPHHSKKFLLASGSLLLAFIVWLASYIGVLIAPVSAPHLVSLATLITGILGTIAVAGVTGQSFVDMKLAANFTNANLNETKTEKADIHKEHLFRCEKLDPKDLDEHEDD